MSSPSVIAPGGSTFSKSLTNNTGSTIAAGAPVYISAAGAITKSRTACPTVAPTASTAGPSPSLSYSAPKLGPTR